MADEEPTEEVAAEEVEEEEVEMSVLDALKEVSFVVSLASTCCLLGDGLFSFSQYLTFTLLFL